MKKHLLAAMAFSALACWGAAAVQADVVSYTVDPARSILTLSGSFANLPLQTQFPDGVRINSILDLRNYNPSLSTGFGGKIQVEQNANQGTVQITGGTIRALNSGSWYGGVTQRTPANFGFGAAGTSIPGLTGISGLIRDFSFELSSASMMRDSADTSLLAAIGGELLYDYGYASNTYPPNSYLTFSAAKLQGLMGLDQAGIGSSGADGIRLLTIPVSSDFEVEAVPGFPLHAHLTGTLVAESEQAAATVAVPEPGTCLMLGVMTSLLLRRRRSTK